jgi:hypothetical protein
MVMVIVMMTRRRRVRGEERDLKGTIPSFSGEL